VSKRSRQRQRAREALLEGAYEQLNGENVLLEIEYSHLQAQHDQFSGGTFSSPFTVQYANAMLEETQRLRLCIAAQELQAQRRLAQYPRLHMPHPRGTLMTPFPYAVLNGIQPQQVLKKPRAEAPPGIPCTPYADLSGGLSWSSSSRDEGARPCSHVQPMNGRTMLGLLPRPSLVTGSAPSLSLNAMESTSIPLSRSVARAASESGQMYLPWRSAAPRNMAHHSLPLQQHSDEDTEVGDVQVVDEVNIGDSAWRMLPSAEADSRVEGKRGARCKRAKSAKC
jgi:hypothetical protein